MATGPRNPELYRRARDMRGQGVPYKRIAAELGVSVNSAYRWTGDIELTPEQKNANLRGPRGPLNPERVQRAAKRWAACCRVW